MVKSAIHIHSTYSDGDFSLPQLREIYSDLGCRIIFMTDHAESFDEGKLKAYVQECETLSDENFRIVAGLEYECDQRMHVLGLGVTSLVRTTDPQEVIQHIKNENGISIIAHPMDSMFAWIESFDVIPNGIETWNSKYDGQFAPRPGTFQLLNRLQSTHPQTRAFYGQDMHWNKQYRGLFTWISTITNTPLDNISALLSGQYFASKERLELPSDGKLPDDLLSYFFITNSRYMKRKKVIKRLKSSLDRFGLPFPSALKSQLRRIF